MVRFTTAAGRVWAVQMALPFTFGPRSFPAGAWILGVGDGYIRLALTDEHFKERRAALEVGQRRIA